jgi:hypothetical protein
LKAAFVVKYARSVPGRERSAIADGREVDHFFDKKAANGLCTEPTWFWAPIGEKIWFVEGGYEDLLGLLATPEPQKFLVKGTILLQDFGVRPVPRGGAKISSHRSRRR